MDAGIFVEFSFAQMEYAVTVFPSSLLANVIFFRTTKRMNR